MMSQGLSKKAKIVITVIVVAIVAGVIAQFVIVPIITPPKKLKPISVGCAMAYEQCLPVFIAISEGFYEEEGLVVEKLVSAGGGTIRTAVVSKELDFAVLGAPPFYKGVQKGLPIKAVQVVAENNWQGFVISTRLKDVKSFSDLKGKTLGFSSPGAGSHLFLIYLEKLHGLDPEKDVANVPLGGDWRVWLDSYKTEKVVASMMWEPMITWFVEEGVVKVFYDPIYIQKELWKLERFQSNFMVVNPEIIEEKPDVLQAAIKAHVKALKWINEHSAEEIVNSGLSHPTTKQYFELVDKPILIKCIDNIKRRGDWIKPAETGGKFDREAIEAVAKLFVNVGILEKTVSYSDLVDPRFVGEE